MAINYPSSLDSLTNPVGSDYLSSPDHAQQHANINDIGAALEAKLGVGSGTPSANKVLFSNGNGTSVWSGTVSGILLGTSQITGGTVSSAAVSSPTVYEVFDGWSRVSETWTFVSSTSFKITGSDLSTRYYPGMRVSLTQTTEKFFIITAVSFSTDTTVTIYGGTDYSLANAAITSPMYSTSKAPARFPLNREKWTVRVEDTTDRSKASPVNGTWYHSDLGTITINVPIGAWDLNYQCAFQANGGSAVYQDAQCFLSTGTASVGPNDLTTGVAMQAMGTTISSSAVYRSSFVSVATVTPYYLIAASMDADITTIGFPGASVAPTVIRATSAYL